MATTPIFEEAEVVQAPSTELAIIVQNSGVNPDIQTFAKKMALAVYQKAEEWKAKIAELKPSGPEDFATMKIAEEGAKFLKENRLALQHFYEAQREEVQARMASDKAEDQLYLDLNKHKDALIKPLEADLKLIAETAERWEAMEREKRGTERLAVINTLCDNSHIYPVADMSEGDYHNLVTYLTAQKKVKDDAIEAARLAEEKRIADEAAEKERLRLENEKLQAQIEADRVEREAKEKADALVREAEAKKAADLKAESDKLLAATEAKLKLEKEKVAKAKAEADRIIANAKAEKEAEEKRVADEAAAKKLAEEELAKASTKTQLTAWIEAFKVPEMKIPEHALAGTIGDKFLAFKKGAKSEIEKL